MRIFCIRIFMASEWTPQGIIRLACVFLVYL